MVHHIGRGARTWVAGAALAVALGSNSVIAGETRCWIDQGVLVAPAAFGQLAGDFIVDLSQAHSQLHSTRAASEGFGAGVWKGSVRLAGERIDGVTASVDDLDDRTRDFPTNIAGVLGADVLRGLVVDLDIAPCRLRVERTVADGAAGGTRLPIQILNGTPAVWATISDGVHNRAGWFTFGTGSAGMRVADGVYSRPPKTGAIERGGPFARLRALSLGGDLFEQVPANVANPPSPGVAGAIDIGILARFHTRLNLRQGWLQISRAATGPSPPRGATPSGRPCAIRFGSWHRGCR